LIRYRPMRLRDVPECVRIVASHPTLGPRYGAEIANLSASPGTVKYSGYKALTATVSPVTAGGQALTGKVQFYLNGSTQGSP
jgi:hypothetical protein